MPALAPLSADMYLPALERLKQSFAASEFYAPLSIASFFVAFAPGELVYGPLSYKFGRKPLLAGAMIACALYADAIYFVMREKR